MKEEDLGHLDVEVLVEVVQEAVALLATAVAAAAASVLKNREN